MTKALPVLNDSLPSGVKHTTTTMKAFFLVIVNAIILCGLTDAFTPKHVHVGVYSGHRIPYSSRCSHRSLLAVESSASATSSDAAAEKDVEPGLPPPLESLPLPPRKGGFLRRIRDTFSHIKDPDAFIARRSSELNSTVFYTYQFFQPVVVVGGQSAVREFIQEREEAAKVVYPDLPKPFQDLHTEWSTLNMDSTESRFAEARGLFKGLLQSPEARNMYVQSILPEIESYADDLAKRVRSNPDEEVFIVPELKELCLQIFSKIFSGEGLTDDQVQMFDDYNSALLTLSARTKQYKRGLECQQKLKAEMLRRFRVMEERASKAEYKDSPDQYVYQIFAGQPGFLDVENYERISVGMMLMIWGAYIECASLMINSAVCMIEQKLDPTQTVLHEFKMQSEKSISKTDLSFWDGMKYTTGILRESLRLVPPGAGVQRHGEVDFELGGYRIPANVSVMLDPRIGNRDSSLFEDAQSFEPLRWVPQTSSSSSSSPSSSSCPFQGTALKLGVGGWFPGGNGAHRCPGVPLAELVSTMFLASLSERFESWSLGTSGLTKDGQVNFVKIPIKICPDDLGLRFQPRSD